MSVPIATSSLMMLVLGLLCGTGCVDPPSDVARRSPRTEFIESSRERLQGASTTAANTPVRMSVYFSRYLTIDELAATFPDSSRIKLVIYGQGDWRSTLALRASSTWADARSAWQEQTASEAASLAGQVEGTPVHQFIEAISTPPRRVIFGMVGVLSPSEISRCGDLCWVARPMDGREPVYIMQGPGTTQSGGRP